MIKKKKDEYGAAVSTEVMETLASKAITCKKVSKLDLTFGNEDLNKLVEKINEIIETKCQ